MTEHDDDTMSDITFSKRLTLWFFGIGTLFLILFVFTISPSVAVFGYLYTMLAFFVAVVCIAVICYRILSNRIPATTGLKSIGIVCCNIPVVILYIYLVMLLMGTARITFENDTGKDLSSIELIGCDSRIITSLKSGESETIWFKIPGDCMLEVQYEVNGERRRETVAGYLTNQGGVTATYRIGSNKEIPF